MRWSSPRSQCVDWVKQRRVSVLDNRRERERVNTRLIETKTIGSHIVNYRKALSLLALLQFNNRAKRLLKVGLFYSSGMPCTFLRLLLPISFLSHISHFSPRRLFDELENLLKRIISFKLDENDKKKKNFVCALALISSQWAAAVFSSSSLSSLHTGQYTIRQSTSQQILTGKIRHVGTLLSSWWEKSSN